MQKIFAADIEGEIMDEVNLEEIIDMYIPMLLAYDSDMTSVQIANVNANMIRVFDMQADYTELAEQNAPIFEEMFAPYGEVIVDAVGEVTIGGQPMSLLKCQLINEEIGLNQYQQSYQFIKNGFLVSITLHNTMMNL